MKPATKQTSSLVSISCPRGQTPFERFRFFFFKKMLLSPLIINKIETALKRGTEMGLSTTKINQDGLRGWDNDFFLKKIATSTQICSETKIMEPPPIFTKTPSPTSPVGNSIQL
jgi:hypothetical protein